MAFNGENQKIDIGILVGGEAGMGVSTSGETIAKVFLKSGYWSFLYNEFPSIIKGGHYASFVHATSYESHSHTKVLDLVIALNFDTVKRHLSQLSEHSIVIFDKSTVTTAEEILNDKRIIDIPLNSIAKEKSKNELMRNTVALGAVLPFFGLDLEILNSMIADAFGKKGEEVVNENLVCVKAGYDFANNLISSGKISPLYKLVKYPQDNKILIAGNDAIALGAIKAGMKLYAAYPMTPASSILHTLAALEEKFNFVTKHSEDEIAAINMVIGAGFAGIRAMCGTSGGGFSLMVEGLGLAAITETPAVIVIAQRPGPATGLPTWTDQGDLHFALNASQGEFPRVVLAPGDPGECFAETFRAFNIAERFQMPVLILSDKYLSESMMTMNRFQQTDMKIDRGSILTQAAVNRLDKYKRYEVTTTGISPRTLPGTEKGEFESNSDEHNEFGFANEESANRIDQVDKRFRKMFDIIKHVPAPKVYGNPKAKISIICWGSTKLQLLDTQSKLKDYGVDVKILHLIYMSPFPVDEVAQFIQESQEIIVVENNATAQLAHLIREKTGITVDRLILKYDGRPFDVEELVKEILNQKK